MNYSGDAAEQVVRLSLEGFEVACRLSGSAAKNIAVMMAAVLKEEKRTKGKARLTSLLKSGKELKVFSIQSKDLKVFCQQAKKYGILYCVLKDKNNKDPNALVDIIARAEDASKIQRVMERFELGKVDKAAIVTEVEKSVAARKKSQAIDEKGPLSDRNSGSRGPNDNRPRRASIRKKLRSYKGQQVKLVNKQRQRMPIMER